MAEKNYAKGIYWNPPRDNAPDFVLGSISIDTETFDIKSLLEHKNGKYVTLDVLQGKEKPYIVVNTYKKSDKVLDTKKTDDYEDLEILF